MRGAGGAVVGFWWVAWRGAQDLVVTARKGVELGDMAKMYYVDTDVTISVRMWVSADSEEDAQQEALERIERDTMYYTQHGAYVGAKVTDCYEDEEE